MSRNPTYDDYLWTENGGTAGEFQAFCLTLIQDAQVDDVIAKLPVIEELGSTNFRDDLRFRSYDNWDPEKLLAGLFQIESWTAMFEVNGFAGTTPQIAGPLSQGRRVVCHHYSDGNGTGSFFIYENGRLTANFEPLLGPADLQADNPSTLTTMMRESGFDQAPTDHELNGKQHNRAAAFALTERLTGVHLEPQTIAEATFTVVRVQMPH
ncbi:hypothetical protein EF294_02495 [Gordonia oryzae]|uniref:Uncharacterized protein n=1 Tax=Gordonia oryzae TaxID=2487349 RepID=A0A3N4GTJ2_9ACTN|nr:DUF6461 domain-containing protein [Gordonia oryzae]RPA65645.1 hypothetical protein EF294_02495 [Gordonia oryzae]